MWKSVLAGVLLSLLGYAIFSSPSSVLKDSKGVYSIQEIRGDSLKSFAKIKGAEGFTVDGRGDIYTGVLNGSIFKISGDGDGKDFSISKFVDTTGVYAACNEYTHESELLCGRPLGLEYSESLDALFLADSSLGILKISSTGSVEILRGSDEDGEVLLFVNDVALDEDREKLYFTVSSMKHRRFEFMKISLGSDYSGLLCSLDLSTNKIELLATGLFFPNGLVLTSDKRQILVTESGTATLLRYDIETEEITCINDNLPGFPDNIYPSKSREGSFWIGFSQNKNWLLYTVMNRRHIFNVLSKLIPPHKMVKCIGFPGYFAEVDQNGNILGVYQINAPIIGGISSAFEVGNHMIFGSYCRDELFSIEMDTLDALRGNKEA